jgi:hypothetical protein
MVAEDMEVAARAGMVATRVTMEDIMEGHVGSPGHFTNQFPCVPMDKTSVDCPPFGEKQSQTIPGEKPQNRFESRFD